MEPGQRRCSATTGRGERCRRRATRDSEPPLCPVHVRRRAAGAGPSRGRTAGAPGLITPEELDHALREKNLGLDEEIALARVCLRRVADTLEANGTLTPEQRVRLATLIFRGTITVARLLRDRHSVSGAAGDGVSEVVERAVQAAAKALGVEP